MSTSLAAIIGAAAAAHEHAVVASFQAVRATAPERAVPLGELPSPPDAAVFARLLARGRVREGAPGTFYLYGDERPGRARRIVVSVVFWLVIMALPILALQLL